MNTFLAWTLYGIGTFLVAEYLGRKRRIGYAKSLFWCLLLSPILGIWIVLMSPKVDNYPSATN